VNTNIEYVSNESGDWTGIYIDFRLKYQGHSIPDFIWIDILREMSNDYTKVHIREWRTEMDIETYNSYPFEFMDLTLLKTQFKLEQTSGDSVCFI